MDQKRWVPPARSAVIFDAVILAQLDGPAAFVGDGEDVPGVLQVASADLVQAAQVSTPCRLSVQSLGQLRFIRGDTQDLAPCCRSKSDQFPAVRPYRWIASSSSLWVARRRFSLRGWPNALCSYCSGAQLGQMLESHILESEWVSIAHVLLSLETMIPGLLTRCHNGIGDQRRGTGQLCGPLARETVQTPVCRALSSAAPQHSGITRAVRKA